MRGIAKAGPDPARKSDAAAPNLLIVDSAWSVVVASETDIWDAAGYHVRIGHALPAALRTLIDAALDFVGSERRGAFCIRTLPWPGIAMTIYSVESAAEPLIAITAHHFRARRNLRHAQQLFGLSPREIEILVHVLSGSGTSQIALALNIADSTVIAHVKSLLLKTKAANRAALVARVLGWEGTFAT